MPIVILFFGISIHFWFFYNIDVHATYNFRSKKDTGGFWFILFVCQFILSVCWFIPYGHNYILFASRKVLKDGLICFLAERF